MPNKGNALDRLFNNDTKQPVSVEEQLLDVNEENDNMFMLEGMSNESRRALYNRVKPESLDPEPKYNNDIYDSVRRPEERPIKPEDIPTDEEQENDIDETLVSPVESKRGRKPKVTNMDNNKKTENSVLSQYENIIRILALGIVNDLKLHKYAYGNFSHQDTCLLLDFITQKINQ